MLQTSPSRLRQGAIILNNLGQLLTTSETGQPWLELPDVRFQILDCLARTSPFLPHICELKTVPAKARIIRLDAIQESCFVVEFIPETPTLSKLTKRQKEICDYAISGATISEIANSMEISNETVKTHLRDIYRKLGVSTRLELAAALRLPL